MDVGGAWSLHRHSTNRGVCPNLDLLASHGRARDQNVGNYFTDEYVSIVLWADHQATCSQVRIQMVIGRQLTTEFQLSSRKPPKFKRRRFNLDTEIEISHGDRHNNNDTVFFVCFTVYP